MEIERNTSPYFVLAFFTVVMLHLMWKIFSLHSTVSLSSPLSVSMCLFCVTSLSLPLWLFLSLCLFPPHPPFPSTRLLWYADMQEFLGLKMIDQACQPWLLLLKMAALAVVCLWLVHGLSDSLCNWSERVCSQSMCTWKKCRILIFVCFRSMILFSSGVCDSLVSSHFLSDAF